MTREELLKEIMKLPKVETDNQISTMNSINVDDLMSAVDRLNKVPDYNDLLKENQELKKHLKVPKAYNLKTLEDYKSYYEDITREQILEDTYIEYCAYVNLAHRYSELKKQLEEKQNPFKGIFAQVNDDTLLRDCGNMNAEINELKNQQNEFIKYLEGKIYSIEPKGTSINYNCEYDSEEDYIMAMQEQSRLNTLKEILQKYKEIAGDDKKCFG